MKVLIISATAGQGHNAIAKATANYYKNHYPEVNVRMDDLFLPEHKIMGFLLNDFHFFMLRLFPRLMRRIYHQSTLKQPTPDHSFSYLFSLLSYRKFKRILAEYQPDAIFCTHVFPACLIRHMEKKGLVHAKTYFIISDYAIHPDSESAKDFDYVFTPHERIHEKAKHYLFKEEQLVPVGLPTNEIFSLPLGKTNLRKKFNIPKDAFVVLITNGGMGAGNNLKTLRRVLQAKSKIYVIVVNGRNKTMKKSVDDFLERHPEHPVQNFGFAENMHELMEVADCIIGKLGGASIFESFIKETPIVVPVKPPFHEYWNLLFLEQYHAVKYVKHYKHIADTIDELATNPDEMKMLQDGVRQMKKENATQSICEFIIKTARPETTDVL